MGPKTMKSYQCFLLLVSNLFLHSLAWDCEVIPGTLKQIDAGVGLVGGVNNQDETFLLIGTRLERIQFSAKHFTVGPAGEFVTNATNHVFKFVEGEFRLISGIQFKQVDAGGDQVTVGVSPTDDVFCINKDANSVGLSADSPWTQFTGKMTYYSCGPYSCWSVNSVGNVFIRRSVSGTACGGSGIFESVSGSTLSMVEVGTDGSVYGIDTAGNLLQRSSVTVSNPFGSNWYSFRICPGNHKHVTYDLGWLYVICSDGSIRRCI